MQKSTLIGLFTIFLVQLTLAANDDALYNVNCPEDDDPFDPTHLPIQGDCTKFLKCSYGKAFTISCPRAQHWSNELQRCEAPKIAKCDPTATTPRPVLGEGCGFAFKPHPTDCTKAIQCVSGKESVIQCLEGMYWSQSQNRCDVDNSACS